MFSGGSSLMSTVINTVCALDGVTSLYPQKQTNAILTKSRQLFMLTCTPCLKTVQNCVCQNFSNFHKF